MLCKINKVHYSFFYEDVVQKQLKGCTNDFDQIHDSKEIDNIKQ